MYFKTFDKKECSGCTACVSSCPKQCITMQADEEGFLYPVIDHAVCTDCGLCEEVCPFAHPKYDLTPPDVYAAYLKDEKQRMQSSSGGAFYAIAQWILQHGGVVYGAAFDENFKLRHIGVDTIEGLQQMRGSKYLQSDLQHTFIEIRDYLEKGRWVYFTGTGCQVAGLKSFLQKEYDNLVTSDLVCHGAPSQLMFDWHLEYLSQKEKGKITSYSFRDCKRGGASETYSYVSHTGANGTRHLYVRDLSPYLYSFYKKLTFRYSCYHCPFAKVPRQGDITMGDYWGIKKYFPHLDTSKGVSLLLVNSTKGHKVWQEIKDDFTYYLSCVDDAAEENCQLVHPSAMPEIRKHCYKFIRERGYKSVAEKEFRSPHYNRLRVKSFILQSQAVRLSLSLLRKIRKK